MGDAAATAAPDGLGWRDALGSYRSVDKTHDDNDDHPVDGARPATSLALQFELRQLVARSPSRWNGPVSTAAKPVEGGLGHNHRLGIRPVARTTRGWARSGITWTNIPHLLNRLNLDPAQHRWFCEIGALHVALKPTAPGRDPEWIFLDDFFNPVLWDLLDQTAALGIPLIGSGNGSDIRRANNAVLTLDAIRVGEAIIVAPRLTIDELPVAATQARSVGHHGVYLVDPAIPRHVVIAPTVERLTPDHVALLDNGPAEILIPEKDIQEFLNDYLPEIRDRIDVVSSDNSVALPPPSTPVLVVTVTHSPRHTITLTWRWEGDRRSAPPPPLDQLLPAGLLPSEWLSTGPLPHRVPPTVTLKGLDGAIFAGTTLQTLRTLPGVRWCPSAQLRTTGNSPAPRTSR